jgi:hypothetical protein
MLRNRKVHRRDRLERIVTRRLELLRFLRACTIMLRQDSSSSIEWERRGRTRYRAIGQPQRRYIRRQRSSFLLPLRKLHSTELLQRAQEHPGRIKDPNDLLVRARDELKAVLGRGESEGGEGVTVDLRSSEFCTGPITRLPSVSVFWLEGIEGERRERETKTHHAKSPSLLSSNSPKASYSYHSHN